MIRGVTTSSAALVELAHAYGIATDFTDWKGRQVDVPEETVREVLGAMDVDVSDPVAALARQQEAPWRRMLPTCVVVRRGESRVVAVHVPGTGEDRLTEATLELETGAELALRPTSRAAETRQVDEQQVAELSLALPEDLPLGYHLLRTRTGDQEASCTVIVTPDWLGVPDAMGERASWGFAAQLYSVRSAQSWGVGDLTDLTDLAVWSASRLGADYLLVNPLHAAEPVAPMEPSPYLPTSRRFFNPLYLRVERIPEYVDLPPAGRASVEDLARGVHEKLDDADVIDRDTSWMAKRAALRLVHDVPRTVGRALDYAAYRARHGEALARFATWCVIAAEHGNDFRSWPAPLQDVSSTEVADYAAQHADEVELETWLQWVLDEQLQLAQAKAVGAGMSLGTMHDLAVGVHPGGADVWRLRSTYASGIQVGAPPDPFNQVGQNWSQPPWRPERLQELAYAPFRDLIASVLRHSGGVRVDHIIGLFRLWWIPEGRPPSEGTYVRYDHEAMIGVLALEAQRAGAVVVGEDLGVVEPSAREYLASRGVLGTSILWWERDDEGRPLPAERWREYVMASVTTHDLPPTAGYLTGEHVKLRDRLGLLTRPLAEETAADQEEQRSWLAEVAARGLLHEGPGDHDIEQTVEALHGYLRLTPARLLGVALTDAVGDRRTQNQPGTTDEYPNWRVPLSGPDQKPLRLEDVLGSVRAARLAETVSSTD
jgi:4-alpha-glucanotransferase